MNFMLEKTNQENYTSIIPSMHCWLYQLLDFQDSVLPGPIHIQAKISNTTKFNRLEDFCPEDG